MTFLLILHRNAENGTLERESRATYFTKEFFCLIARGKSYILLGFFVSYKTGILVLNSTTSHNIIFNGQKDKNGIAQDRTAGMCVPPTKHFSEMLLSEHIYFLLLCRVSLKLKFK